MPVWQIRWCRKKKQRRLVNPRASVESYTPGKRGPRTKKERLSGELAGIRAELAAAKEE
jgi:hypothetical protein